MLNRHNFNIAALAAKDENRFTLNGILIEPNKTIVTDGHQLTYVTGSTATMFGARGVEASTEFKPFVLAVADCLALSKQAKKGDTIGVQYIETPSESAENPLPTIDIKAAAHLSNAMVNANPLKGNFPDYQRVFPKDEKYVASVCIDAALLSDVVKQAVSFQKENSGRLSPMRIDLADDERTPIRLTCTNTHGQEFYSIIMPVKDSEEAAKLQKERMEAKAAAVREEKYQLIERAKHEALAGSLAGLGDYTKRMIMEHAAQYWPELFEEYRQQVLPAPQEIAA